MTEHHDGTVTDAILGPHDDPQLHGETQLPSFLFLLLRRTNRARVAD
jgi:hypothetical protein